MMKYSALILSVISLFCLQFSEGSRHVDRLNQYRARYKIFGTRFLWDDAEMEAKAQKYVEECKDTNEDGIYGIFHGTHESNLASSVDTVGRVILRIASRGSFDEVEDRYLAILNPKAYRIGCAVNEKCTQPIFACYLNSKTTRNELKIAKDTNFCETCSATFHKCSQGVCTTSEETMPQDVPEDVPETVTNKEAQNPSDETSTFNGETPNTSHGFIITMSNLGYATCIVGFLIQYFGQ